MKTGFNWGQIHHALQLEFQSNGYAPDDFVAWIKRSVPHERLRHCRFSGTMSNTMLHNIPGYGHAQHVQQIRNQRKAQPTISYLYPFLDLYQRLGCVDLSFTINSHAAYQNGTQGIEDCMFSLDLVNRVAKITHIELENETYFYHSITGATAGSPNLFERIQLSGSILRAGNMKAVEDGMRAKINHYLDFLQNDLVPLLRRKGYMQPLGISLGHATNLRERVWNEEVLKRNFYDFLIPHIYLQTDVPAEMRDQINQRLAPAVEKGLPCHVTEWNWNYQAAPNGPKDDAAFRYNFNLFMGLAGVEQEFFHCLSQGNSAYSWQRR
jgi:hypothetical protein